jgi:hypothetical protein
LLFGFLDCFASLAMTGLISPLDRKAMEYVTTRSSRVAIVYGVYF